MLLLFVTLSLLSGNAIAQNKGNSKVNKLYNNVLRLVNSNEYDKAIHDLYKIVRKYPDHERSVLTLADLLVAQKRLDEAEIQYKRLLEIAPSFSYKPWFYLGKRQLEQANYAQGQYYFGELLKLKSISTNVELDAKLYLSQCLFALEALRKPVEYEAFNFGDSINTSAEEYLPSLTADDETMIFTRRTAEGEDFYSATKFDSLWQSAVQLPKPLNSVKNEGAHCLTADGNTVYFTACYRNDSYGGCDIYYSRKSAFGWERPVNLGGTINTEHWESQPSISYDGKALYFISNRPSGLGGSDIWKSVLQADSTWSTPINLGPIINTRKDEISPFIHPDDKTLYFASEGREGMGKLDIYLTKKTSEDAWQEPKNLGYPINTEKDESSLFVNHSGTLALFSSQSGKNGRGGNDLYYFNLPKEIRPDRVIYVKGKVTDRDTKKPLSSLVEVVDLVTGNVVHNAETFPSDGKFLISLPAGKSFAFNVSKSGYLLYSEHFQVDTSNSIANIYNLELESVKIGSSVILRNIFYESNSYTLEPKSLVELKRLALFLSKNPGMLIEIQGHTDNKGSKALNKELSTSRAKTVYEKLLQLGVDPGQIQYSGYGDSEPIAENSTEYGRAVNRRTQFKIIKL